MFIFKQNRYIALLVSVILVCFSSICLLFPKQVIGGKPNKIQLDNVYVPGRVPLPRIITNAAITDYARITKPLHPQLAKSVHSLNPFWKPVRKAEWITPVTRTGRGESQVAAAKSPPVMKKALHKPATAIKGSQTAVKKVTASQQHPPTTLFFSRTELLSQEQQGEATWRYAVSKEDLLLLQKIVMAEAEGEPYQGKVAVANVVLNRLRSANYPDTIYDVIYQKSQFSPVANGRLKRVNPNEDTIKAVNAALSGVKEVSDDTYYFLSLQLAQDLTVHHSRKYAKTIGNHTFYK